MASNKITVPKIDIYSAFLKDLATGAIHPNQRVGEETLAARWKVSRLPVRDALIRLEAEGLVERKPSSGTYVKKIDLEEMEEIYTLRAAIEGCVVRKVVQVATDTQLDDLEVLARRLDAVTVNTSAEEIVEREMKFHLGLCKVAGMLHASRMLRIQHLLLRSIKISLQVDPVDSDMPITLHQDLMKALRTRDADYCEAVFRQHVKAAYDEKKALFRAQATETKSTL